MTANSFVATIVLVDATKTPLLPHFGALVLGARTDGLARVGTRGTSGGPMGPTPCRATAGRYVITNSWRSHLRGGWALGMTTELA